MPALKEFTNFINLNLANLAETYARLLIESDESYQAFSLDSRLASARKLLKAVAEACETQASDPLLRLFSKSKNGGPRRWTQNIDPPHPMTEVECLGQTLTPVVTNLEAGKFLWQALSQVRATVQAVDSHVSVPLPALPVDDEESIETYALIKKETEKNYQGQVVLNEILQISLEKISLEEQLERMLNALLATPWLPALPKGAIFLVEGDPNILVLKAQRNLDASLLTMCAQVPFGHCLCGRAVASGEIQFADCVDHRHENQYEGMDPHGHYNIPILSEGQVLGAIVLYLNEGHHRDEREVAFLKAVANTLAGLIRHKQMEEELYQQNEYLSALNDTTLALMNRLEVTDLLESIVARAAVLMDTPHGYVSLVEPDQFETVTRVGIGNFEQNIGDRLKPGEGVAGKVWQTGQILNIEDYQALPNRAQSPNLDVLHTWIGVPLKSDNQVVGMIGLARAKEGWRFNEDEIDLLTQFAELASVALDNARLYTAARQELAERKRVETALETTYDRLELTFDNMPVIFFEWDLEGNLIRWNKEATEVFGWPAEEALGKNFIDLLVPPEYRDDVTSVVKGIQAGTGNKNINENITKTGHRLLIEWYNEAVYSAEGKLIGGVSMGLDITERVRLEQEIQASLTRRASQIQTSTEVAQEIAAAPALDDLFRQVVNLVQERFGYYHTHVYTLEELSLAGEGQGEGTYLVLQAGAGTMGRQMKEAGYKIALTTKQSLIARAARSGKPVLVLDVFHEPAWLPNPLLPKTKSELAVPIKLKDEILGILDVQSDKVGGVSQEDQLLLMGLCGQIAVAIDDHRTTEALRESEERTRLIFDTALDAIVTMDAAGLITDWNYQAETIFGWSQQEAVGQLLSDLIMPPQYREAYRGGMDRFLATGEGPVLNKRIEITALHREGHEFPVELAISPVRLGDTFTFSAFIRDITVRKQAEESLQKGEERFRQVIASISHHIYMSEMAEDGHYLNHYISPNVEDLTGYPHKKFVSDWNFWPSVVIHPDDRELAAVQAERLAQGQNSITEYRLVRANGQVIWVRDNARVQRGDTSTIIYGVVSDITERRQVREKLRESEERYRLLLEASPDPIVTYDEIGQVVYINPAFTHIFGWSEDELLGKRVDFVPEETRLETKVAIERLFQEGKVVDFETRRFTKDRRILDVQQSGSIFKDKDGNVAGSIIFTRDITKRRQTEVEREQLLADTEILYHASAELNAAQSYEDILRVFRQFTLFGQESQNVSLNYFDCPWTGEQTPEWVHVLARWSTLPPDAVSSRYPLAAFPSAATLLRADRPTIIEDVTNDPDIDENVRVLYTQRFAAKSTIFIPLVVGGQWIGYVNAIYQQPTTFPKPEVRRLMVLANQAAVAVQSIQRLAETERRAHELAVLNELGQALTARLNVEQVVEEIYQQTNRLVDTTNFYIALYDPQQDMVSFPLYTDGEQGRRVVEGRRAGKGLTEYVIQTREPLLIKEDVAGRLTELGIEFIGQAAESWLGVPLMIGQQVIGLIAVQSYTTPGAFDEGDRELLIAIANRAAVALQNARQFEQIQARASREQTIREITEKMRAATSLEELVKTAAQELGQHFSAEYTLVDLGIENNGQT